MTAETFDLPSAVSKLVKARNDLRSHFQGSGLKFTLDGNLVGDIGEAIAAELFGINLKSRNHAGVDGVAPNGMTVQIKATGTGRGPAFRPVDKRAAHLLFFDFDFELMKGKVIYNGPEAPVVALLKSGWKGQRLVARRQIAQMNAKVLDHDRLVQVRRTADSD